jgi:quinol monooxygenase YgiN
MVLHVLASCVARPDTIGKARTLLIGLVEPIRSDAGCIRCDLVRDIANEAAMVFVEEWQGEAELDRHLADPHIAEVVAWVAPLLAQPFALNRYHVLG